MKMKKEFLIRSKNIFWTYHWTLGASPIVCFSNPKVFTNVIYSQADLEAAIKRGDIDKSGKTVPYQTLLEAYSERGTGTEPMAA